MPSSSSARLARFRTPVFGYFAFIFILSFFTYFYGYASPPYTFWDEPYHVAAAEKYLSGTFFMEQHPPLGKLLIALGEKVINANPNDSELAGTDYINNFPSGFSFAGYRFFPTLLGWLTAPLLFLIFLKFTRKPPMAGLLSLLYVFDNAMIVHSRGAMIDSVLLFFSVAMVYVFLQLWYGGWTRWKFGLLALLLGMIFGAVMTTKLVGLIMVLLYPALLIKLYADVSRGRNWKPTLKKLRQPLALLALSGAGFLAVFVAVWQIHFSDATTINPKLSNNGFYGASQSYKDILAAKRTSSPFAFPVMLWDSMKFVSSYNEGVPRLDMCKSDENGSPPFMWPTGGRTINYRWEKVDDNTFRYLYLVPNPVGWLCGLIGLVLAAAFLLARALLPLKDKLREPGLMLTFLGMYICYMIAVSRLARVMYLYHYFTPLVFSFILFGLVILNINSVMGFVVDEKRKMAALTIIGVLVFAGYQVYRPLSYYLPITNNTVQRLNIFPLWDLHCVNCAKNDILVVPK